jgi:hypothetical protein
MSPKEKSKEILNRFYCVPDARGLYMMQEYQAKECALIAVDELIKDNLHNENIVNGGLNAEYWFDVKKEIENL